MVIIIIDNNEKLKELILDIYIITMADAFLSNSTGGYNTIMRNSFRNISCINKFKY